MMPLENRICWLFFFMNLKDVATFTSVNLASFQWYLENENLNFSLPTELPSSSTQQGLSVHTTLLKYGIIENPYNGFNDVNISWIPDEKWIFKTNFKLDDKAFDYPFSRLKFYGIDTVSSIFLNNECISKTTNMFTSVTIPLHSINKINSLEIRFDSPTKYAKNQSDGYRRAFGYKVPPVVAPPAQHGRDHPNFIRKEQCSFSWDWGPSFPTIGIWQPAFLELSNNIFLDELKVFTVLQNGHWTLFYEIVVQSFIKQTVDFQYKVFASNVNENRNEKHDVVEGFQTIKFFPMNFTEDVIIKWWPHGYGSQQLYTAVVQVMDVSEPINQKQVNFGFRTVELIEEPIENSEGLSFYFKINGKPIFLKGANWIPADSFQERVSEDRLAQLLISAKSVNINALRVWGGGIYEKDIFYQLADELGIVIWQDLMFAVALYPVNKEFLESVAQEVQYQVRRLQHHPSIIAWSGNNENEAAIVQTWWDEVKTNRDRFISDYGKLYGDTIKPIVIGEDKTRPFLISSPSNGNENSDEHYIAKNPQDERYGDVHFYDYKNDCWDPDTFPKPRFASEYGYQSFPSYDEIKSISEGFEDQLFWNSSLLFHRQHHAHGNTEIERFIQQHFELPARSKNSTSYLSAMIYLSQIVQALCVKYESEHYRRLQDNLIDGKGHTMGALYWQLNDIWQGPSWSSIQYSGQWKVLHHHVRDFFAPVALSAYKDNKDNSIVINIVRDHAFEKARYLCNVSLHDWKEFGIQWNDTWLVEIPSLKHSMEIFRKRLTDIPVTQSSYVTAQIIDFQSGDMISKTELFISNFTGNTLRNPHLALKVSSRSDSNCRTDFEVELTASSPAAFVWLVTEIPGRFKENGFLMNTPTKRVTFETDHRRMDQHFQTENPFMLSSLFDLYQADTFNNNP